MTPEAAADWNALVAAAATVVGAVSLMPVPTWTA
jgi:hypothetical protein